MWWNRNTIELPLEKDGGLYYIKVYKDGQDFGFILDSGANINKICRTVVDELNLPTYEKEMSTMIADGSYSTQVQDMVEILVCGSSHPVECVVCPDYEIPSFDSHIIGLLGLPFLKHCILDFPKEKLFYKKDS